MTLSSQGRQLWKDDFQKQTSDNTIANDSGKEDARLHRMRTKE